MFEVITLGSGSAGNATLIRGDRSAFLVDAGLSARQLKVRLGACRVSLETLSGVLLTHEHGDHTRSLKVLLASHAVPVYCNALTARALQDGGLAHSEWRIFQNASAFDLGEFSIRSFSVPHDAVDPVGFRISAHGACFGVLTDLGHATRVVFENLRGVQALLIETNYDEELLLQDTRRPWSVKQRIQSRHGHLSNGAAARFLAELDAPLEQIILAHLSRDCNSPQRATEHISRALTGRATSPRIHCALQDEASPAFQILSEARDETPAPIPETSPPLSQMSFLD
jgi:phosphoribosyl 1,2-cyclic phosphodiesterase